MRVIRSNQESSEAIVAQLDEPTGSVQPSSTGAIDPSRGIGHVVTVVGTATATRADGSAHELTVGSPIFEGSELTTGTNAALAVVFVDGTSFSLGAEARMVVDSFVYDSGPGSDSAAFDLLHGVFLFVSGEVAASGDDALVLTTPVATIGIRGTALVLRVLPIGFESLIGLVLDPDGNLG